tara:strand:- start:533 stop:823 length:291 start_codon:yes stop_codon:yes gene_type:complete
MDQNNLLNIKDNGIEHLDSYEHDVCIDLFERLLDKIRSFENFNNQILNVKDAARYLKVSEKFIYQHLDEIPHVKIGPKVIRFHFSSLNNWMKKEIN